MHQKIEANTYLPRLAEGVVRKEIGLDELVTYFEKYRHLYTVGIDVNAICNLACGYCYLDAYNPDTTPYYVSLDDVTDFIAHCADDGVDLVALVGKEPFAGRRGLTLLSSLDLMSRSGKRFRYGVVTNGTLVHRVIDALPRSIAYIDISLDGPEVINDAARGMGVFRRAVNNVRLLRDAGFDVWISGVLHRANADRGVLEDFVRRVVGECGCGRFYLSPVRNFTGKLDPFLLSYLEIAQCQATLADLAETVVGIDRMILDHPYEAVWRDYFWPLTRGAPSRLACLGIDTFGNVLEQLGPHSYRKLDVFPHGPWATCRVDARGEYLSDVEARTYAAPPTVGSICGLTPRALQRRAMRDYLRPMLSSFLRNMERAKDSRGTDPALTSVSMPPSRLGVFGPI